MVRKARSNKVQNGGKRAVGYVRVSTDKQAEGLSLQNQRKTICQYSDLHGFKLSEIFSDNGSGKNIKGRLGLLELLKSVETEKVHTVIVYRLDRMFRNTKDALDIIEKLNKKNVSFHSFTEKIDTESPQGRFFLTILASFATMEREIISDRIKDVLHSKRERNELISHIPPYGYDVTVVKTVDGKLVKKLIENPKEQRGIEEMVCLHQMGLTYGQIADDLRKLGYKTKTGKRNWNYMSVRKIVQRYC